MNKKNSIYCLINKIKKDYIFRTYTLASISVFVTLIFTCYNIYLGIAFNTSWNISIAVYYIFLLSIKLIVLLNQKKLSKLNLPYNLKNKKTAKFYLNQSIMLFIIDLMLIAPIALLILQKKDVQYTKIAAIATATYTISKIFMATKNALTAKKIENLSIKMLRQINLKDALVSILTLQYILIVTFDEGITREMQILSIISSFTIWTILIVISICNLKNAIKIKKSV